MSTAIHGLLLAGGAGSRLGGVDKGWMPLAGRPLVQHVLARMGPQVQGLRISANRHLEQYAALGHSVMPDDVRWQGMGPLAALATLQAQAPALPTTGWVMVFPCDTPLLPPDLVARLMQGAFLHPQARAVFAQSPRGPQPSLLLAQSEALASVPDYLATGQRSLRGWLAGQYAQPVVFDDDLPFANANDAQALQGLEQLFSYDA